ncbi:DEAD/DEAH box helicase [Ectobacillus antri]|uniref:DEAD/DEAH box helicase n=1 Tax=Ectobacillus antri TaxID=2486280 RepID=UPI000F5A1148|nr:DEAD/DEAH box helicase [Ectobacillus antri]
MMIKTEIPLHLQQLDNGWFLWSEAEDTWADFAFAWHTTSFYGTLRKPYVHEGNSGFLLTAPEALEIATLPFNSFAHFRCHDLLRYRNDALRAWAYYQEGNFLPDFSAWADRIYWKPLEDELPEDIGSLFSAAITYALQTNVPRNEQWENALRLLEHRTFSVKQLEAASNEEDWLRKIGFLEDDTPFTIGLRLLEPQEDYETWKLETILMTKRGAAKTYVYTDSASLPKRWKSYEERILQTYQGWEKLVPWLVEDGVLRHELYEGEAWRFLTEASNELLAAGVDILLPSWWQQLKQTKLSLRAKVKGNVQGESFFGMHTLINFDWKISTGAAELSEAEFLALVEQNRRLININGEWIKLDPAFIEHVKKLMEKADQQGMEMKDLLQQELLRKEPEDIPEDNPFAEITIELDDYYESLLGRLLEIGNVPKKQMPDNLQATLRPYQQTGIEWLLYHRELGFGALLADDMGLGKTLSTISYLLYAKENRMTNGPALVIAPTSVLGNWQKELERFAPSLRVGLHYGSTRAKGEAFLPSLTDKDVILTSYTLANLDEAELSSYTWSSIILDEAQNIKNAHTKQSRAVRHLTAHHKVALTGTPMENRLSELWAIFDFLNPGYLGSLTQFHRRFVTAIEKDRDEQKIQSLQRLIAPFLLRRTKQDPDVALNLPDKQEQKEYCALTVEQASLYEQMVRDTLSNVQTLSGIERRGFILLMLNKLKQICNHPALYLKEEAPQNIIERSMKMEKLQELVENIRERDESCIIFTQYIRMGDMLKTVLEQQTGEPVLFLNGSVKKAERDHMIDEFQNGRYKIFILSLKAGGTGLNLTAANHVIHYDRWWNPAVENQATDRAYRIGQKRFVHVHKLITTGTLEEKIDDMLERKQSLNNTIITSDSWITELTTEELQELLHG